MHDGSIISTAARAWSPRWLEEGVQLMVCGGSLGLSQGVSQLLRTPPRGAR